MRIISGQYRGRIIKAPEGRDTRPTTDRVRESIISSIVSRVNDMDSAYVLDLFAGSGALGIECLSRGAAFACFCDSSKKPLSILKANLQTLGIGKDRSRALLIDALKTPIPKNAKPYDIVLLDPPYAYEANDIVGLVAKGIDETTIAQDALCIYEYDSASTEKTSAAIDENGFKVITHKTFGSTCVDTFVFDRT